METVPSFPRVSRRQALRHLGVGIGAAALANTLSPTLLRAAVRSEQGLHHAARAKNVIFLLMNGGVSQVDTFDPKPALEKYDGKPMPGGAPRTENRTGVLMRSPFSFQRHGDSGLEISELFPHLGKLADELCVVRSMIADIPNHEPSLLQLHTGHTQVGRPSFGAWLTYALGTENKSLPGFVVLCPERPSTVGAPLWGSAFLPAIHQGTLVQCKAPRREKDFDPEVLIPFLRPEEGGLLSQPRNHGRLRRLLARLNEQHRGRLGGHEHHLQGNLESMEQAFRMQAEAPEVFDLRKEGPETHELYGEGGVARGCLMARRLVERGVRMVQVICGRGDPWDAHNDINQHRRMARQVDRPIAALLTDLRRSGLLDQTLVVFATEFGRTPVLETGGGPPFGRVTNGRDHNPHGFSMWLAGAGVKQGIAYGATDEFGFRAVENPVHFHDLHATLLHLFGIDHERLTYQYSGRQHRLTDVAGRVVHEILA